MFLNDSRLELSSQAPQPNKKNQKTLKRSLVTEDSKLQLKYGLNKNILYRSTNEINRIVDHLPQDIISHFKKALKSQLLSSL